MKLLLLLAATAISTPVFAQCSQESAFGIPFGSNVRELKAVRTRNERPLPSFSAYRLNSPDNRFSQLIVEAGTKSGKISSVKASVPISFKTTEEFREQIVPQGRSLVEEIARASSITIDTSGLPPYSAKTNGLELMLDWESWGANSSQFLHVICTNEAIELETLRATPRDEWLGPQNHGGAR